MILITDALAYASPQITSYYGEIALLHGVPSVQRTGTLAGSALQMNTAISNLVTHCGVGLAEALYAATEAPARLMNVFESRGSIEVGKRADLVLMDLSDFAVLMTFVGGVQSFTATAEAAAKVSLAAAPAVGGGAADFV